MSIDEEVRKGREKKFLWNHQKFKITCGHMCWLLYTSLIDLLQWLGVEQEIDDWIGS